MLSNVEIAPGKQGRGYHGNKNWKKKMQMKILHCCYRCRTCLSTNWRVFLYHMHKLRASLCYTLFYFERPQLRSLFTPSTDQAIALNTFKLMRPVQHLYMYRVAYFFCTFCVHTKVSFPCSYVILLLKLYFSNILLLIVI